MCCELYLFSWGSCVPFFIFICNENNETFCTYIINCIITLFIFNLSLLFSKELISFDINMETSVGTSKVLSFILPLDFKFLLITCHQSNWITFI